MPFYKALIRVKSNEINLRKYTAPKGIDWIVKPYDVDNGLYDILFQTSDKNPEPSERHTQEDLDREVEKFRVAGTVRDTPFKTKTFGNKAGFTFSTMEDDKNLDSIDDVRSKAKVYEEYNDKKRKFIEYLERGDI